MLRLLLLLPFHILLPLFGSHLATDVVLLHLFKIQIHVEIVAVAFCVFLKLSNIPVGIDMEVVIASPKFVKQQGILINLSISQVVESSKSLLCLLRIKVAHPVSSCFITCSTHC